MALVLADRVRDTTTTTGTGTVTLSGTAPTGYQTFGAAIGNANTTYYTIAGNGSWEVGIGTYTAAGTTLSRDTVLASSNAGALVNFAAGSKDVFVTYPAEKSVNYDAAGNVGIGTTAPASKLQVNGYGFFTGTNSIATGAGVVLGYIGGGELSSKNYATGAWQIMDYGASQHSFYIGGTGPAMFINSSSNVGIGTSSPAAKLDISGDILTDTNTFFSSNLYYNGGWKYRGNGYGGLIKPAGTDGSFSFLMAANNTSGAGAAATATERMRIDSSGNVGIGTSSPQSRLHIDAPTGNGSFFTGVGNNNSNYPPAVFGLNIGYNFQAGAADVDFFNSWTGATGAQGGFSFRRQTGASSQISLMRIDGAGNVGIGVTSPNAKLDILAGSNQRLLFTERGTSGSVIDSVNAANNAYQLFVLNGSTIAFQANASERMRITSGGNVAVGNSNASPKFSVTTGGAFTWGNPWDGNVVVFGGNGAGSGAGSGGLGIAYDDTNGCIMGPVTPGVAWRPFKFYSDYLSFNTGGGTEAMRVNSNGNVGIGTVGGSYKLQVHAPSGSNQIAYFVNESTGSSLGGIAVSINSGGYNSNSYHFVGVTQGVAAWYLFGNGNISYSSDRELKKNIEAARSGYLDDLNKLRVVKYNWRHQDDDTPRELGLIAQEVEEVFPSLVRDALHEIDDTGKKYKTLNGSVFTVMLIKAVQELTARVAQLEGK